MQQELRLTEPVILCSIMKWCWSRMPGGVVSWPVFDGFQIGERESNFARNAFETFIPISTDSQARKSIIFDFYDLLAATAAHGKMNGLGGRKLSRLAGWWAFELSDEGKGFEGGYRSWTAAADASSHLFFAYLRTLSPEEHPSMSIIERIPRSLQALLASTEYPPETPTLMQRSTPRVVMLVDAVSPTPFSLLRRAKHFEFRSSDRILQQYSEFEDPTDALTEECKRVLMAISNTNSAAVKSRHQNASDPSGESWSAFQNTGFGDWDEKPLTNGANGVNGPDGRSPRQGLRSEPRNRDHARPTTPSWADFMSAGFAEDDANTTSTTLLMPPAKQLPPLGSRVQSPTYVPDENHDVAPGELAAIANVELDDAFWWVWMTSLAGEEPAEHKAVFGRCAVIETSIMHGKWLIMEEQVKGASPDPEEGAYIAKKKGIFSFTKRGKLTRKGSSNLKAPPSATADSNRPLASPTPSRRSLAPDQQTKIKQAAAALRKQDSKDDESTTRRGRYDEAQTSKTHSTLTMGLQSEAGTAMKWTHAYDKGNIRSQYLGDPFAGRGKSKEDLRSLSSTNVNGHPASSVGTPTPSYPPEGMNYLMDDSERHLPVPPPKDEPTTALPQPEPEAPAVQSPPQEAEVLSEEAISPAEPEHTAYANNDSDKEYVPDTTHAQPTSAMDKEIGVDEPSSARRRPVPRTNDHPAYRQNSPEEQKSLPSTPTTNVAALAAQRAMVSKDTSPESQRNLNNNKLKKQQGAGGGLKKLFGRKQANPNRQSFDGHNGNGLAPPTESSVGRRLSVMRKKATAKESPKQSPIEMSHTNASELEAEPVMPGAFSPYQNSTANASHADSVQDANPEHEFARFDQDNSDMPFVTPMEKTPDIVAPQAQRNYNVSDQLDSQAAIHEEDIQEADDEMQDDPQPENDAQSETTMEEPQDNLHLTESKDRWATIRENAARRAAQRASEEHSVQSRPSQSVRTDDGETSGEESKSTT